MQTKHPYTGDPNAKLTMCSKKLRRHLHGDFDYVFQRVKVSDKGQESEAAESQASQTAVAVMCRHCKQNPVKEDHAS